MMRILKVAGIVVAVLVLLVAALPFLIDANQFRGRLETSLGQALARQAKLGNLKISILSGGMTADDIAVADNPSFSHDPFLRAKSLHVAVELLPLVFSRKLHVTAFTVDQPEVTLLETPAGEWNFSSLGVKPKGAPAPPPGAAAVPADLSVNLVKISAGRFSVSQTGRRSRPLVLENVNLELRDFSGTSAFPFSFSAKVAGGGDIALEGKAGPLNAEDAVTTPLDASLKITRLALASSGFVEPGTGIDGLISFDGSGQSDGHVFKMDGRVRAEKLKLVKAGSPASQPVQFDFTVEHDLRKRSGVIERGIFQFGRTPAPTTLTGTYALSPEPAALHFTFEAVNMALPELAPFLPALDIVLPAGSSLEGGTANAKVTVEGPLTGLVTSGSLGLTGTRIAGFNLGAKMAAVEKLAGLPGDADTDIQTFTANFRMAPEGTSVENLTVVIPTTGNLTGSGIVSPQHALDFKMRALLHTSGAIMATLGQRGDTGIPFLIGGTSQDPVFRPDVKGVAEQKVQQLTDKGDLGKAADSLVKGLLGKKK